MKRVKHYDSHRRFPTSVNFEKVLFDTYDPNKCDIIHVARSLSTLSFEKHRSVFNKASPFVILALNVCPENFRKYQDKIFTAILLDLGEY